MSVRETPQTHGATQCPLLSGVPQTPGIPPLFRLPSAGASTFSTVACPGPEHWRRHASALPPPRAIVRAGRVRGAASVAAVLCAAVTTTPFPAHSNTNLYRVHFFAFQILCS